MIDPPHRGRREEITDRVTGIVSNLQERRVASIPIDTVFRAFERDIDTGAGVLAGAVAFRIFMFLVPYVFFGIVGLGVAAAIEAKDASDLAHRVGIGALAATGVESAADLTGGARLIAMIVSGSATLLGARSLVKVLWATHQLIWRVRARKVQATRAGLALIVIITASMAFTLVIAWIRDQGVFYAVVALVLYTLVPAGLWLFISWRLPHADCPWWALLPGAAVFGVGTSLLHAFTVTYIAHLFSSKSETYGVLGASLAMLFWAYLLGRLITASAVVSSAFWTRRQNRQVVPVLVPVGDGVVDDSFLGSLDLLRSDVVSPATAVDPPPPPPTPTPSPLEAEADRPPPDDRH